MAQLCWPKKRPCKPVDRKQKPIFRPPKRDVPPARCRRATRHRRASADQPRSRQTGKPARRTRPPAAPGQGSGRRPGSHRPPAGRSGNPARRPAPRTRRLAKPASASWKRSSPPSPAANAPNRGTSAIFARRWTTPASPTTCWSIWSKSPIPTGKRPSKPARPLRAPRRTAPRARCRSGLCAGRKAQVPPFHRPRTQRADAAGAGQRRRGRAFPAAGSGLDRQAARPHAARRRCPCRRPAATRPGLGDEKRLPARTARRSPCRSGVRPFRRRPPGGRAGTTGRTRAAHRQARSRHRPNASKPSPPVVPAWPVKVRRRTWPPAPPNSPPPKRR